MIGDVWTAMNDWPALRKYFLPTLVLLVVAYVILGGIGITAAVVIGQ